MAEDTSQVLCAYSSPFKNVNQSYLTINI
jgi:hypothetical protein